MCAYLYPVFGSVA